MKKNVLGLGIILTLVLSVLAACGGSSNEEGKEGEMPNILMPNGTFTIVTEGRILANNTDEGPVDTARGQALVWEIDQRTEQAPTALISFD